jgi:putative ABC transport system permease protein
MNLESFVQDLRYSFRTLRRDAGFTVFAILVVALGVAASSTVFSVANALLMRPLPFRDPGRLVWIVNHDTAGLSGQTTQVGYMLDLRGKVQTLSEIGAYMAFYDVGDNLLTGTGEPERLSSVPVSDNFFQVIGVQPQIGRLFTAEECKWHGPKAVLLTHGLWARRFASDPQIVGRVLTMNDAPATVIGVMPAWFDFASVFNPGVRIDMFTAFPLSAETNRWGNTMAMIGRLNPGATAGQAQAELRSLGVELTRLHPERNTFEGFVRPLAEHVSGRMRAAVLVLAGAVGVVMLIVCANLSNLLLARMASRQKEIAIRAALGARRGRLIRQMLTESIALSCGGAVLGVVLAIAGTRFLAHLDAMNIALLASVRTDFTALGFTMAMAVITGIVFGLAPALHVPSLDLHDALKDTSRGSTEGRRGSWVRSALVVSEIAFACVLLVGAGLLIRSFLRVLEVDAGFRPERAAALRVDPNSSYRTQAQQNAYFSEVLRRVGEVPGIEAAGLTDTLPLGKNRTWGAGEKGHMYPKGQYPSAFPRMVSEGYREAMGIPLKAGRDIAASDLPDAQPVMLINESMARAVFPNENPLGKIVRACGERMVVGVVGDVRHLALEQASGNEMYLPMRQCNDLPAVELVVRTRLEPGQLASAVRLALRPIAPNLPGSEFRLLQRLVDKAVSPRRFIVLLLGGFAAFALVLASLGIYAVISYSVSQRTQEIGIRMALGASAGDLQLRILGQTLGLAAIGVAVGSAAAWSLGRALRGFLFGVTASDPVTFVGMLLVLCAVAALAGYLPARRASRIDPMVALRAD